MELNKFVGNKIRQFREEKGLSQEILAKRLNTTRQTISRYENGDRKANQDVLFELAKLFNQSVDCFFSPQEEKEVRDERLITIAAHLDDDVTDDELRDILAYIEMKKTTPSREVTKCLKN
ncbi:Prophage repressor protein [Listeria fleischmannii FSL S10-1203]|uniref:Prophage repressor protein n=1 Tax=Listeria fleischmannii FSL S10-1203 TaxID=1265822 RepID=W7DRS1_9LIST|nr:Prophage repressor protein [Listeria fleischmannii FSL S10-1203]